MTKSCCHKECFNCIYPPQAKTGLLKLKWMLKFQGCFLLLAQLIEKNTNANIPWIPEDTITITRARSGTGPIIVIIVTSNVDNYNTITITITL